MRLLHLKTQWKKMKEKKTQKTLFIPLEINLMTFKPAYENNSGGTGLLSDNTLLSFQLWQKKEKGKGAKKEKKKRTDCRRATSKLSVDAGQSLRQSVSLTHLPPWRQRRGSNNKILRRWRRALHAKKVPVSTLNQNLKSGVSSGDSEMTSFERHMEGKGRGRLWRVEGRD